MRTEKFCTIERVDELLFYLAAGRPDTMKSEDWCKTVNVRFSLLFDDWGGHDHVKLWASTENAGCNRYLSDLTELIDLHEKTTKDRRITLAQQEVGWTAHCSRFVAHGPTAKRALMAAMLFDRRTDITLGVWPAKDDEV